MVVCNQELLNDNDSCQIDIVSSVAAVKMRLGKVSAEINAMTFQR
jgi:hypothetical protein